MSRKFVTQLVFASVTWLATCAHAAPVVFTNTQYQTSATAVAGALVDTEFGNSGSVATPLITSAFVYDATHYASGSGIATVGLLSTDAEVSGASGFASSTGSSEFTGTFAGGGIFTFNFNYSSLNATGSTGYSDSTLSFTLKNNGATWISQVVPITSYFSLSLFMPSGTSSLDLLLSSQATTLAGGNAQNVATLGFQVSDVPEPTTWLLMFAGLLFIVSRTRRDVFQRRQGLGLGLVA